MDIVVPIRMVPDPVEELDPNPDGTDIDRDWLEFVVNEFDEHALAEALLLADEGAADSVTVVALDDGLADVDQELYMASAKGADRLVKLEGVPEGLPTTGAASLFAGFLEGEAYDAVFTGVQSPEDRSGQLAGLLASHLDVPHVSVVTSVEAQGGSALVEKEFSGGVTADYEVDLPAVVGVQAAREPPQYVPVSKVRQAMKSADVEAVEADGLGAVAEPGSAVTGLHEPETGEAAEMLDGSADDAVDELFERLAEHGVEV